MSYIYTGIYSFQAALNMITKTLSVDLKSHHVMAMALHPGWVQTDMGGQSAPVTTEQSVEGILKVLAGASAEQNGGLVDFEGKVIPW